MTNIAAAALALAGIGFAAAAILALAQRLLANRERNQQGTVADAVDALLPQTQCAQCGYPGCRPYAVAVAGGERIDLCVPGGPETAAALKELLGRDADAASMSPAVDRLARIRAEECTGCALCLAACPVDAIAGAPQHLHAVIDAHCTGCELCVPVCPVDCIDMVDAERPTAADA